MWAFAKAVEPNVEIYKFLKKKYEKYCRINAKTENEMRQKIPIKSDTE